MKYLSVLGYIFLFIKTVTRGPVTKSWFGKRPSFLQGVRLKSKTLKMYKLGKVLTFQDIASLAKKKMATYWIDYKTGQIYYGDQVVNKNGKYEETLLNNGSSFFCPHEVMQIRGVGGLGIEYCSKIIHGTLFRVGHKKIIKKEIKKIISEMKKVNDWPKLIEINHTHPTVELALKNDREVSYILGNLSDSDINLCKNISTFNAFNVVVRAITTSGISYTYQEF